MKKLLLAMTALTAVGLYGSVASAAPPSFPTIGPTALSAGFSNGQGDAQGQGFAAGFGSWGTTSGGIAGYSSVGLGGATTFQNAILPSTGGSTDGGSGPSWSGSGPGQTTEPVTQGCQAFCAPGTGGTNPNNALVDHTYAGGTSSALGGGATNGEAFASTNGYGGWAVGVAASSAQGDGQGFGISAATTISAIPIFPF